MRDVLVCFRLMCESALAKVSPRLAAEVTAMRRIVFSKFGVAVLVAVGCAGLIAPCGFAQDAQPSVADAARAAAAAKKDKEKAAASKTVITDDSLGSGAVATSKNAGAAVTAQGSAAGATAGDGAGGGMSSASLDAAWERLQATEASLDRLEPMGKSEVATTVLGGNSADFPGRADWEEKLYAEKTAYVTRSRQLIAAMKEALLGMAQMNSGDQKLSAKDPKVIALTRRTTQLMQLAQRTETEFQGVVNEGRNLAQAAK